MATSKKTQTGSSNRSPAYIAYAVREPKAEGQKAIWTRLGAAWRHDDGKGFNLTLEAQPVDGRITLRVYEPKTDSNGEAGA